MGGLDLILQALWTFTGKYWEATLSRGRYSDQLLLQDAGVSLFVLSWSTIFGSSHNKQINVIHNNVYSFTTKVVTGSAETCNTTTDLQPVQQWYQEASGNEVVIFCI